jgi:hypothetical protein
MKHFFCGNSRVGRPMIFLFILFLISSAPVSALENGMARTPPMG